MSDESLLSGGDTGGEPPVADPSTSTPAAEPAPFSFYGEDGINPGIQFEDSNKSVEGLFKKYQGAENPNKAFLDGVANLQYMAGQKGFERPADDAPESVKEEFDRRMRELNGAPKEASEYGYEKPEGVPDEYWDQSQVDGFSEILHKHGASPELAKELFESYVGSFEGLEGQMQEQANAQLEEQRNLLKSEFGVDADKMVKDAISSANALGIPQSEIERIGMTAEGVKALAKIKSFISSDVISNNNSAGNISNASSNNFQEMAIDAGRKSAEAYAKGDNVAGKKFYEQQSRYNEMYLNSLR